MLRKCCDVKLRADLADCGLYIFSLAGYKLMCYLDTEKKYMWEGIGQDVLPFLAKN